MGNKFEGQFKVWVGEDNIIHLALGNLTEDKLDDLAEWTEKVKTAVESLYQETGKRVLALIDISNLKKYDSEAFLILADLMKTNEPYILKSATFGGDPFILAAQDALLALAGRDNLRAFKTKEEALGWLALKPET